MPRNSTQSKGQSLYSVTLQAAADDRAILPDSVIAKRVDWQSVDPKLLALFEQYSWARQSKQARLWIVYGAMISVLMIALDLALAPSIIVQSIIVRGFVVPSVLALCYFVWTQPRNQIVEGLTFTVISVVLLLTSAWLGAAAGGEIYDRYLTASLFAVSSGAISLPIAFRWSIAGISVTMATYFVLLLSGPTTNLESALVLTFFYATAIFGFGASRLGAMNTRWIGFLRRVRELRDQKELARLNEELKAVAGLDPLTGIANRRTAKAYIESLWNDSGLPRTTIAFMMIDIDHFKNLNDSRGHAAGDDCIRDVADAIGTSLRESDKLSRHGGEEFLVVLTGISCDEAQIVAERIRRKIELLGIQNPGCPTGNVVTASIGIAFQTGNANAERVLQWSDEALYDAKRLGRNRICMARPLQESVASDVADPMQQLQPQSVRPLAMTLCPLAS